MSISFSTYKGSKIFHLMPYYEGLSGSLSRINERLDSPFGYSKARSVQNYTNYLASFLYKFNGKEVISTVNDLFDELKGRWSSVWFPSWTEDFKLTEDIGSTDVTLNVESSDSFGTLYPLINKTGNYVFIYVNNNEWYVRNITNWGADDTIVIDSALGKAYAKERVQFICFLYKGRLDIDTISWKYTVPDVAECELFFSEVPHEYTTTTTSSSTTTTTTTTA